ncbi:hypothetical protein HDV00_005665 [Rhizophlyctis rosea]|nr:hypothetical protein HDV00_005665 [Rhizophlyctis rosea]
MSIRPSHSALLFNPLSYKPRNQGGFLALFYCGFALAVLSISLLVSVFASQGRQARALWPLRMLRTVTKLMSTVLFMPLIELFVSAFLCRGFGDDHGMYFMLDAPEQCKEELHMVIPAAVGLIYLALQSPLISLVYVTIDPSGHEADSKTTGRIDTIYTLLRFVLAITHEIASHTATPQAVAILLSSLILSYLVIGYQPFFVGQMNDIRAGIFVASFVSAVQSCVCLAVGGYEDGIAGFVVLCALVVPGFLAGYLIARRYRKTVMEGVYARLKDPNAFLSDNRPAKTTKGNVFSRSFASFMKSAPYPEGEARRSTAQRGKDSDLEYADSDTSAEDFDRGRKRREKDFDPDILTDVDDIVNERPARRVEIFRDEWHVELSCRYLQQTTSPRALQLANKLFEEGEKQFPKSAQLVLMKAYYIRTFGFQRITNAQEDLRHIKSLKPPFDTRFFIFFEECALEQQFRKEDLQASHLNVTGYAEVVQLETNARKWHLATLVALKSFWEYLKSEGASAECMPYLIEMAATHQDMAERYYSQMLSKYPNSKQVLRRYGNFLLTVVNDLEHAQRLLDRAEDIENAEARDQTLRSAAQMGRRAPSYRSSVGFMQSPRNRDNERMTPAMTLSGDDLQSTDMRRVKHDPSDDEEKGKRRESKSTSFDRASPTQPRRERRPSVVFGAIEASASGASGDSGWSRELDGSTNGMPPMLMGRKGSGAEYQQDLKSVLKARLEGRRTSHGAPSSTTLGAALGSPLSGEVTSAGVDEEMGEVDISVSRGKREVDVSRRRPQSDDGSSVDSDMAPERGSAVGFRGKDERERERFVEQHRDRDRDVDVDMDVTPDAVPTWAKKAGPGSIPSVPSATSSQRENRQTRYLKSIFEGRFRTSIDKFRHWITFSCVLLLALLIAGCALTLITYENITSSLGVAYNRMRPRLQALRMILYIRQLQVFGLGLYHSVDLRMFIDTIMGRFTNLLYNIWQTTIIPVLQEYHLDDPSDIQIKRVAEGKAFFDNNNPYFLAQLMYNHGDWIANRTTDWILANGAEFANDPHPRMFLENYLTINRAYQQTAFVGLDAFLSWMQTEMMIMGKATSREVKMLSLALMLPKKFIAERIESLEIEVENIMEEIEDQEAPGDSAKLTVAKEIPPASFMANYGRRRMTKIYSIALAVFGLIGALMFVPALVESKQATEFAILIQQLSDRTYRAIGTTSLVWEVAANDSSCWLPNDAQLNLNVFVDEYRVADEAITDGGDVPSILKYPAAAAYIEQKGVCRLSTNQTLCLPGYRYYNETAGLTYSLVTSGMMRFLARWLDEVTQFVEAPLGQQNYDSIHLPIITEVVEDLLAATPKLNDILVEQVRNSNAMARSINIILFTLAALTILVSYLTLFRWITQRLERNARSISNFFFTIPADVIKSIPDLKRFIESGGAMVPAREVGKR